MTVFTDLLVALWTWGLSFRLMRAATSWAQRAWALSIAMVGVAALTGGHWHALSGAHPWAPPLWSLTMTAAGLSTGFLAVGTARGALSPRAARVVVALVALELPAYLIFVLTYPGDPPVAYAVAQYGASMLLLLVLESYSWITRRTPSSRWFLAGFVMALLASATQASGLTFHPAFNHNDLAHLIQLAVMGIFFRGAMLLKERDEDRPPSEAGEPERGEREDRSG